MTYIVFDLNWIKNYTFLTPFVLSFLFFISLIFLAGENKRDKKCIVHKVAIPDSSLEVLGVGVVLVSYMFLYLLFI